MENVEIKVTILGSGTSTGVPIIACPCAVCQSTSPFNNRTRASILIHDLKSDVNLVVDTSPDFRAQMLRHKIQHLEYALYTHAHADHCHGLDDLRAFYFFHKKPVECWIHQRHAQDLRERFAYVFKETGYVGTKPQIILRDLPENILKVGNMEIESVDLPHGNTLTSGFRIGSFAYATDFKFFPEEVLERWRGKVKVLIASGVGFSHHPTHSSVPETLELFKKLDVSRGILTHLAHSVDYERDKAKLPENVEYAYDGMEFTLIT